MWCLRPAAAPPALVEGLGVHVLGEHCTPDTAPAVSGTQLDLAFGPSPGRETVDERRAGS